MSSTSTNPVQNKVVNDKINDLWKYVVGAMARGVVMYAQASVDAVADDPDIPGEGTLSAAEDVKLLNKLTNRYTVLMYADAAAHDYDKLWFTDWGTEQTYLVYLDKTVYQGESAILYFFLNEEFSAYADMLCKW